MKKGASYLLAFCLLIIPFYGCDYDDFSDYINEESHELYLINEEPDNTQEFINCIKDYAKTFKEGLILGYVQLIYNDSLKDMDVIFTFTERISKRKSRRLRLYYSLNQKGIYYTNYLEGVLKGLNPFEKELDTSEWKINFSQGLVELQKHLIQDLTSYKRIGCDCYADKWAYDVFMTDSYASRIDVTIDPTLDQI